MLDGWAIPMVLVLDKKTTKADFQCTQRFAWSLHRLCEKCLGR